MMQMRTKNVEKLRDSNMELLRITAMLLVLIVHASFLSLGAPVTDDFQANPTSTALRLFSQSASIICVNLFILISGWYGIKAKPSKMLAFICQVYILNFLLYYGLRAVGGVEAGAMRLGKWVLLLNHGAYWFVKSYIILYIFTPVLNAFVNEAGKKHLEHFLIIFFCVQTVIGFWWGTEFSGGYSALSFMGLYVLARYLRLYPDRLTQLNRYAYLAMYLAATVATTAIAFVQVVRGGNFGLLYYYNSPLVIFASVGLLLFFSKVSIHSKFVNWVAASSFAAYVVHCSPVFFETYLGTIKEWFGRDSTAAFLLHTTIWIAAIFAVSIMLDKVRLLVWKWLTTLYAHLVPNVNHA